MSSKNAWIEEATRQPELLYNVNVLPFSEMKWVAL